MLKKNESGKDYFLSGRDANWLQIGSSIFSSNIGSEHLVGLAGAGFLTGMAMAHWEMHGWVILLLGWAFVPLYDRMKVFTMPEYLELRFSRGSRNVLSLLTMASLVLTKIAATIYAGDVVVRTLLNVDTVNIFGLKLDVFWAIALGLASPPAFTPFSAACALSCTPPSSRPRSSFSVPPAFSTWVFTSWAMAASSTAGRP
jgi:SSS family solute:Na+ symporter